MSDPSTDDLRSVFRRDQMAGAYTTLIKDRGWRSELTPWVTDLVRESLSSVCPHGPGPAMFVFGHARRSLCPTCAREALDAVPRVDALLVCDVCAVPAADCQRVLLRCSSVLLASVGVCPACRPRVVES